MKIQTINQVEFNQINASRQVITHEYPPHPKIKN